MVERPAVNREALIRYLKVRVLAGEPTFLEARKAGVLIGLENRDGPFGPWEFDPLRLRFFNSLTTMAT